MFKVLKFWFFIIKKVNPYHRPFLGISYSFFVTEKPCFSFNPYQNRLHRHFNNDR